VIDLQGVAARPFLTVRSVRERAEALGLDLAEFVHQDGAMSWHVADARTTVFGWPSIYTNLKDASDFIDGYAA